MKGVTQVYTGNGKGKTMTYLGLAFRLKEEKSLYFSNVFGVQFKKTEPKFCI